MGQDVVLAFGDVDRLLLERDQVAVDDEEAHEMPGWTHRKDPELEARRPGIERQLPRQVEQLPGATQAERRKARWRRAGVSHPGAAA